MGVQEHLLGQVFGIMVIAAVPVGQVHGALVPGQQGAERIDVPILSFLNKLRLVSRCHSLSLSVS